MATKPFPSKKKRGKRQRGGSPRHIVLRGSVSGQTPLDILQT